MFYLFQAKKNYVGFVLIQKKNIGIFMKSSFFFKLGGYLEIGWIEGNEKNKINATSNPDGFILISILVLQTFQVRFKPVCLILI